jgi:penicillin V acylase-like amidase (Ntn superfamily)
MENSVIHPWNISYYPAGMTFQTHAPDGKPTFSFTTKYGIVGTEIYNPKPNVKLSPITEGANDAGLSLSGNMLPGSIPHTLSAEAAGKAISFFQFVQWVLGCFASVDEVKEALNGGVSVWVEEEHKNELSNHFAITDKTGKSIVVECLNGSQQVYDNPVGVLTNGPAFPWHLDNLSNYAHLTNIDKNTGQFGSLKVSAPDSGIAMHSVPSSQVSWGRFVKAAFYKQFVKQGETPDEEVLLMAHIMNNFDRPEHLTIDTDGHSTEGGGLSEITEFTVLFDSARLQWYIRPILALNWIKIDLAALKGSKEYQTHSWKDFPGFKA